MITTFLYCPGPVHVLVKGLYQLEVTVFGYNNPTGGCQDCNHCCDGQDREPSCCANKLCDSFFIYCLRTIGSSGRSCLNSYVGARISTFNKNDCTLNFSQSMMLGLENSIILQGLTDNYTVLLLMFYPD